MADDLDVGRGTRVGGRRGRDLGRHRQPERLLGALAALDSPAQAAEGGGHDDVAGSTHQPPASDPATRARSQAMPADANGGCAFIGDMLPGAAPNPRRPALAVATSIVRSVPAQVTAGLDGVVAVVLTYRRPMLAGQLVRSLLDVEGFRPDQILVVVNGDGGLDDPALEASVRVLRLSSNLGPAGGFRAGLEAAFDDEATRWAYLCEDDVGLFNLPAPRVAAVIDRLRRSGSGAGETIGAVVAYGRRFTNRGHSINFVPGSVDPPFVRVDVAAWGATLVSREVLERGVLPATEWFFGYEDFDFFCRVRAEGLAVVVDSQSAVAAERVQTLRGRNDALSKDRPLDAEEPWRAYYVARNFFHLARAHGSPSWLAWHLAYSVRRLQLASSGAERRATVHGLFDGLRGRWGPHPRYTRSIGEHAGPV